MQIINLQQGSPAWHQHRATALNASDAPAMLGISPYKTRAELVQERATGITPEVSAAQQRIFDRGHAIEALARPLAEDIIGEEISPCVGTEGRYSASFDGITFGDDTAWECKTLNASLRQALPYQICDDTYGASLPEHYRAQMEHQAMVSGCERILFTAAALGDDGELSDVRHCWYTPDPAMRQRLIAGWAQFEQDVAAWQPPTTEQSSIVAAPVEGFAALVLQVQGRVVASNMDAFKAAAQAFIERLPTPDNLRADQDFVDAQAASNAIAQARSNLKAAKAQGMAQMGDVEAVFRAADEVDGWLQRAQAALDNAIKAKKDSIRADEINAAKMAFNTHVQRLELGLKGVTMRLPAPDFAAAIKGLRSLGSIKEKLTAALIDGKSQANTLASRISENLHMLNSLPDEYAGLFPDRQELVHKDSETLHLLIQKRVADHQQAEAKRLEQERQRMQAQAQAEAASQALAQQAVSQAQDLVQIAKALDCEKAAEAKAAGVNESLTTQPQEDDGQTITLGQINTRLAPIRIDCAGLEELGFRVHTTVKAAKHYRASDFPAICRAIAKHAAEAAQAVPLA